MRIDIAADRTEVVRTVATRLRGKASEADTGHPPRRAIAHPRHRVIPRRRCLDTVHPPAAITARLITVRHQIAAAVVVHSTAVAEEVRRAQVEAAGTRPAAVAGIIAKSL